jgi:cobalt/nickel transport system permease protein
LEASQVLSQQRIDPRVTLGLAVLGSVLIATFRSWPVLVVAVLMSLALLATRPVPPHVVVGRLLRLELFLILLWGLLPIEWGEGGITWKLARASLPAMITLRAHAILFWVTAWVEPMGWGGVLRALQGWRLPPALVQIAMLSVRYLSLLRNEFRQMRIAMASRGYGGRPTLATYQVWATLIGMLFLRSLERAEKLHRSMEARSLGHSFLPPSEPIHRRDLATAVAWGAMMGTLLLTETLWG